MPFLPWLSTKEHGESIEFRSWNNQIKSCRRANVLYPTKWWRTSRFLPFFLKNNSRCVSFFSYSTSHHHHHHHLFSFFLIFLEVLLFSSVYFLRFFFFSPVPYFSKFLFDESLSSFLFSLVSCLFLSLSFSLTHTYSSTAVM